jgi:hypothetical protein
VLWGGHRGAEPLAVALRRDRTKGIEFVHNGIGRSRRPLLAKPIDGLGCWAAPDSLTCIRRETPSAAGMSFRDGQTIHDSKGRLGRSLQTPLANG